MSIFNHIIIGIVIGYIVLSISESASHNYFLHGEKKIRIFWEKLGKLGSYILNSWYSHHVVHHYKTFKKDYVTQFSSKEEEEKLKNELFLIGKKQIVLNSYGLRVGSSKEWIKYSYPHLPHYLLMCYIGGFWFTIGAIFPLFFYEWLAHFVHPYLHMSYNEALKNSSPFIRWFLLTPYFKFLAQHHYLHHRYVNCNFNLLLGGDFFWKRQRFSTEANLLEMEKLGLFVKR
ncbi:MAG: hypothetical protein U0457_20395 [Candidatus Sericytochromatia bacterium]